VSAGSADERAESAVIELQLSRAKPEREVPMAGNKLYIWDSSSSIDRKQAAGRFSDDSGVTTLGVGSIAELHDGLAALVASKATFTRLLVQTHGNSGMIFFNHIAINAPTLRGFVGKGYDQLFPRRAKVYFDGCNVANGDAGWDFLAAAGQVFLTNGGGIALGWTSLGTGLPGWIPFVGGHTEHLWGDMRFIEFDPGGGESSRYDSDDGGLLEQVKAAQKLDSF
jgi:hypothetical protein